ncbi:MAG: hypothetical protein A3H20_04455 [Candidatus Levybacteria bacterium RIFCSPLOWO2_12_FULL_41_12]|nr:MAG: hypothetical protein A3H20_04455 [Candidatus Levybacteria bacterium RIFCSPLOWO2_12_FULL_41_12]
MKKRGSRLNKNIERKSKRNIILSFLGIILILTFLIKIGIPLLATLSFQTGSLFGNKNIDSLKNSDDFVSTPILNPLPEATNSARVEISGSSLPGYKVQLYINGELIDEETAGDGDFSFRRNLSEGENIIKLKATHNKRESEFTDPTVINIKLTPPEIEIESPTDGQEVSKSPFEVKGKTDSDSRVTINGYWAMMDNDRFSYMLPLKDGDNDIKVEALDEAGNKAEKVVRVKYAPK